MDKYIILTIVILLVCGLFWFSMQKNTEKTEKTEKKETFKSEYRESDIFLPTPVNQYQYELDPKNELIIKPEDKNNIYPLEKSDMKIEAPIVPINKTIDVNAAFEDVKFIRDNGVELSMKKKIELDDLDYKKVVDGVLDFNYPKNSYDLLRHTDAKSISKDEYNNNNFHDIYNNSISKVINNISKDQIDSITGQKYMITDDSNTSNLYKPLLILKDKYII